eukprot:TRINITY_DN16036_c0_g1_i1.p1 TRINITY_DN16036_c0_g1~~TRINITY_DN16036_c0_g1_i1.p1  ORF type:complete len:447 (+),score=90.38 TRINITY_DN16036_c0_g1_i1:79-1419(+)
MSRRALGDLTNLRQRGLEVQQSSCSKASKEVSAELAERTVSGDNDQARAPASVAAEACADAHGQPRSSCQDAAWLLAMAAEDLHRLWARLVSESRSDSSAALKFALSKFGRLGPPPLMHALMSPPPQPPPAPLRPSEEILQGSIPCSTAMDAWYRERLASDPELVADLEIQDLLNEGTLLRPCHEQAERHRLRTEADMARIDLKERHQVVLWLAQVCSLRGINDSILQASVLLLDRFCATREEPLPTSKLHLAVIAILGTAIKVAGFSAGAVGQPAQLRCLMEHLGQGQFSKQDMMYAELEVLEALRFELALHTPVDFLECLTLSMNQPAICAGQLPGQGAPASPVVCVASFLLQLALGDARLLHRYPYAVLASGAVYMGLWCTQATVDRHQALVRDVILALEPPSSDDDEAGEANGHSSGYPASTSPGRSKQRASQPGTLVYEEV